MIEIIRSIVIGAVQGVSEFFPISSSGHLVLIPYIFKWNYEGLSFDVALHFGTAIAILAYFWRDWLKIISSAIFNLKFRIFNGGKIINKISDSEYPSNFLWQILVASIPAAIVGFFLDDIVEEKLHSPLLIAFDLVIFGFLLWVVDKYSKKDRKPEKISYKQSFLIGCAQSIALFPGVSRSGITITASRALGLDREKAARFSFLLATPAMFGAFIFKAKDLVLDDFNWVFISGVIASGFFGFIAIKYLLQYLKGGSFAVFLWYRIAIAIIVAALYFVRI